MNFSLHQPSASASDLNMYQFVHLNFLFELNKSNTRSYRDAEKLIAFEFSAVRLVHNLKASKIFPSFVDRE